MMIDVTAMKFTCNSFAQISGKVMSRQEFLYFDHILWITSRMRSYCYHKTSQDVTREGTIPSDELAIRHSPHYIPHPSFVLDLV